MRVNQLVNPIQGTTLRRKGRYFKIVIERHPTILPYIDQFTIINLLPAPRNKKVRPFQHAQPHLWNIMAFWSFPKVAMGEINCLKQPGPQSIRRRNKPPTLFSKHNNIKGVEVPKPPSSLGLEIKLHFFQWIFGLSSNPPHQKFLINAEIESRKEDGSKNHDIAYVGMVWMTDLIRIFLLVGDNKNCF